MSGPALAALFDILTSPHRPQVCEENLAVSCDVCGGVAIVLGAGRL